MTDCRKQSRPRAMGLSCVAVAALSACSSGGGSGSTGFGNVLAFSGFSNVPETGQVQLNGEAVRTTVTLDSNGNITSIGVPSTASATNAVLETENGTQVALTIDRTGSNLNFDSRNGDIIQRVPGLGTIVYESGSSPAAAVLVDPGSSGYEYQTYGAWAEATSSTQVTAGVGSFGSRTATSGMPAAGASATYTGGSTGLAQVPGGTVYDTESTISVTTDFATATITSSGTQGLDSNDPLAAAPVPLSDLDFSGSGTVTGTGFVANVDGATSDLTGAARAQFYGPSAEEIGGTFSAVGTGTTYFGAFGGAQ